MRFDRPIRRVPSFLTVRNALFPIQVTQKPLQISTNQVDVLKAASCLNLYPRALASLFVTVWKCIV